MLSLCSALPHARLSAVVLAPVTVLRFKRQHEATSGVVYASRGHAASAPGLPCGAGSIETTGHEEPPRAGPFRA